MPAISHFAYLGFKPERSEKLSKAFITSMTESSSLKNMLHHPYKQNVIVHC